MGYHNGKLKLPMSLGQLDFSKWILGLYSAFISGGTGAIITGTGVISTDPVYFASHVGGLFKIYLITFLSTGFFSMMNFLHQQPVPPTLTTLTNIKEDASGKETTSIQVQSSPEAPEPIKKDGN